MSNKSHLVILAYSYLLFDFFDIIWVQLADWFLGLFLSFRTAVSYWRKQKLAFFPKTSLFCWNFWRKIIAQKSKVARQDILAIYLPLYNRNCFSAVHSFCERFSRFKIVLTIDTETLSRLISRLVPLYRSAI